jgi:hypothetical protein
VSVSGNIQASQTLARTVEEGQVSDHTWWSCRSLPTKTGIAAQMSGSSNCRATGKRADLSRKPEESYDALVLHTRGIAGSVALLTSLDESALRCTRRSGEPDQTR